MVAISKEVAASQEEGGKGGWEEERDRGDGEGSGASDGRVALAAAAGVAQELRHLVVAVRLARLVAGDAHVEVGATLVAFVGAGHLTAQVKGRKKKKVWGGEGGRWSAQDFKRQLRPTKDDASNPQLSWHVSYLVGRPPLGVKHVNVGRRPEHEGVPPGRQTVEPHLRGKDKIGGEQNGRGVTTTTKSGKE